MILSSFSLKFGLVWLLLTSASSNRVLASLPSNETTFPCPGHSLSHSSPEATVPVRSTTDPDKNWLSASPNTVGVEKGFVQRPFRRVLPDGGFGYSKLVSEQLRVEASTGQYINKDPLEIQRIRNEADNASGNWGTFQVWEDAVADFIGCSDSGEGAIKYGFTIHDYRKGSCAVNQNCFEFDEEFLDDLAALRDAVVLEEPSNTEAFLTFTNEWGHGAVDKFKFGQQSISLFNDDEGTDGSRRPVLYLGRAGGTALDLSDSAYTEDECLDPQPSFLVYSRWDDFQGWKCYPWDAPCLSDELIDILHIGFEASYHDLRQGNVLSKQVKEDFAETNCTGMTATPTPAPTPATSDSTMPTQEPAGNLRSASNNDTPSGAVTNAISGSVFVVQTPLPSGPSFLMRTRIEQHSFGLRQRHPRSTLL
eukprot:scaffold1972_cov265-Chaetoceros_neogracile.AAC.29